jgi:hypothetical protein
MTLPSTFIRSDVTRRVWQAIERLQEYDSYLLIRNVNERSITHHLAVYLQQEFPAWDVDVEYNRDGHDIKRLFVLPDAPSDDTNAKTVYPDIIVHRRGTNKANLLVIEVKKRGYGHGFDEKKLVEYTKPLSDDGLGYRWGLHLILQSNEQGKPSLQWYVQGKPSEE